MGYEQVNFSKERSMKIQLMAAVVLAMSLTLASRAQDKITIKGSDTMVHLVSSWAEKYHEKTGQEVSVTGGGSGTGVAALINGTTDLCMASRDIKRKEILLAKQKGFKPHEIVVARDAIVVVVHKDNPLEELTLDQLKKIFTGEVKNWKEVGGADAPITILSRETSSGTYVFFMENVLQKEPYASSALLMPATSAMISEATTNKTAIGYVGLGYAVNATDRVKTLKVKKDADSEAVEASEENVNNGSYTIARPLYFYAKSRPRGEMKDFVDYCLSEEGQEIVQKEGYVPAKK